MNENANDAPVEIHKISTPFWDGEIVPRYSANLTRLTHRPSGKAVLFARPTLAPLGADSVCYGIPLILPPNRVDGGKFSFEGREYRLPINQPETGCHIHGLVLERPFRTQRADAAGGLFSWEFDESLPEFEDFGHRFRVELEYRFDGPSFDLLLRVENKSALTMPLGVGFHTAFDLPAEEDARIDAPRSPGGRWRLQPERRLPDGSREPWPEVEQEILDGQRSPSGAVLSGVFPLDGAPRLARVHRRDFTLEYGFDGKFGHMACWNGDGESGFVCIEPMSCMTNAVNVPLPPEVSGLRGLAAGETITFSQTMRIVARS